MGYHLKRIRRGEKMGLKFDDLPKNHNVNVWVSDLWLNHDHSEYKPCERDGREDWNLDAMFENAKIFAVCIANLSGEKIDPLHLIADFFARE